MFATVVIVAVVLACTWTLVGHQALLRRGTDREAHDPPDPREKTPSEMIPLDVLWCIVGCSLLLLGCIPAQLLLLPR